MKRAANLFLAYFPLGLLALQVIADFVYLIDFDTYAGVYFYLGWAMGSSFLFSLFLVILTERLKFCEVSKWAARAQMGFSIVYLIIRQDNIYNISIQIVLGLVAIILTWHYYAHKFPLCRLGLLWIFISKVFKERSCEKGIEQHDRMVKNLLRTKKPARHEIISS